MGATFLPEASIDARRTRPRDAEEAILFREGVEMTCIMLRRMTNAARTSSLQSRWYSARADDQLIEPIRS